MQGYLMVESCLEVAKFPVLRRLQEERCGDPRNGGLQPGQITGRVENLHALAEAGVPQAWWKLEMEAEGYFDQGQVPDTPEMHAKLVS